MGFLFPQEVRDELFRLQKLFSKSARVNWVSKKNLHITFKFLGNVSKLKADYLDNFLSKIKFEPMELHLFKKGAFPTEKNPKIIWVNLIPNKKIINFQHKIDSELFSLFKGDQKFQSHITLGRIKRIKDKRKFFDVFYNEKVSNIKFKIDHFCLIKSELTKDGPKYSILKKYLI